MVNGTHFERVNNMSKLTPSEFSYNTDSWFYLTETITQQCRGSRGFL
jgi:hypothetical protein